MQIGDVRIVAKECGGGTGTPRLAKGDKLLIKSQPFPNPEIFLVSFYGQDFDVAEGWLASWTFTPEEFDFWEKTQHGLPWWMC